MQFFINTLTFWRNITNSRLKQLCKRVTEDGLHYQGTGIRRYSACNTCQKRLYFRVKKHIKPGDKKGLFLNIDIIEMNDESFSSVLAKKVPLLRMTDIC